MRKTLTFIVFFLSLNSMGAWAHSDKPLGNITHDWHPDPAIKSTISLNFDFHAGENFVSWSPPAHIENREGKECLVGAYMLFDIDDDFAFDTDEDIFLDLTFYRPDTDGYILSYDQAIKPTALQKRFKENTTDSPWHMETIRLDRARFANRKYYGTDLAIGGIGSQLMHPEGRGEAVLCDIKIYRKTKSTPKKSEKGTFSLKVVDKDGNPIAARVGLYRPDGWAPIAGHDAILVQRYTEHTRELPMVSVPKGWSENGRYVFFTDGDYKSTIPEGDYQLFVMKGPEYKIIKKNITISAHKDKPITVTLERFDNLPKKGWLSGDDHIHISRPTPEKNDAVLAFMEAEDIHVANLLQMGNLKNTYFKQYDFGKNGLYGKGNYSLVSGQESPRTSHRGHTIGLNTEKYYTPAQEYYIYDDTADHIHEGGGIWGYAHVAIDAFNVYNGLALDVPRGKVDFVEMLQYGMMNTTYMYDFLNMGFKLTPSAGSDYPYMDFPGSERLYAQVKGQLTAKSWFTAVKSGRSFVSNWMSIDFAVNGDREAVEYNISSGDVVTIEALVKVNPDFDNIDRIELVSHGDIIHTQTAANNMPELSIHHSFSPKSSMWIAIRAYGKGGALLHTTPLYIYVDGATDISDHKKAPTLAKKYHDILTAFRSSTPRLDVEFESFDVADIMLPKWAQSKERLNKAIDEAIKIYDNIIQK